MPTALGKKTRYQGREDRTRVPDRDKLLKGDFWQYCDVCGWEWPTAYLRRNHATKAIVCPHDDDRPGIDDIDRVRQQRRAWANRFLHRRGMRFF